MNYAVTIHLAVTAKVFAKYSAKQSVNALSFVMMQTTLVAITARNWKYAQGSVGITDHLQSKFDVVVTSAIIVKVDSAIVD